MISQKAKLHNRFDFEVYDTETGETEYAQAENIVLNNMWSKMNPGSSTSAHFTRIGVGTGSGTLSPARTTLFSYLAGLEDDASIVEVVYDTPKTGHITKKRVFSETMGNGVWTEVGISASSSTSNFVTHALITDSEGNPITVNKTNTKIVTVYATIFAEFVGDIRVSGNVQNRTLECLLDTKSSSRSPVYYFTGLLDKNGGPSLFGLGGSVGASFTVDAANKKTRTNLARVATTVVNMPIRGIILGADYPHRWHGDAVIPNDIFTGSVFAGVAVGTGDGTRTEFDLPLPLVRPLSEKIYINGIEKVRGVDYTMHYGLRSTDTHAFLSPDIDHIVLDGTPTREEIIEIPQPPGVYFDAGSSIITGVSLIGSGQDESPRVSNYSFSLSLDGVTWTTPITGYVARNAVISVTGFTPDKYKYLKAIMSSAGPGYIRQFGILATPPAQKNIKFTSPPPAGAVITADFSTDYIHKSSNFVLDVQSELLWGEGV